jgi:50S ribosome-binding GTPase
MSSTSAQPWLDRLRGPLAVIAGPEWVERSAAVWQQHAAAPRIRVTLYGPYNAGKTTLIRRLLHEAGQAPPPGLAVGAVPTTGSASEVGCGDIEFVDTPGLAGGAAGHEVSAQDAIVLTDAVLVVLLPQLLTIGDLDPVVGVATGGLFRADPLLPLPAGALLLAIARADEGGVDPIDDLAGYTQWCQSKKRALAKMLRQHGAVGLDPYVHVVIADLDGAVGGSVPPTSAYDHTRAFDGMAGLCAALAELPARRAELRAAAHLRFWSLLATRQLAIAEQALAALKTEAAQAQTLQIRLRALDEQVAAFDDEETVRLRAAVGEVLEFLLFRPGEAGRISAIELRQKVSQIATEWFAAASLRLRTAVAEALGEVGSQLPPRMAGSAELGRLAREGADLTKTEQRVEGLTDYAPSILGALGAIMPKIALQMLHDDSRWGQLNRQIGDGSGIGSGYLPWETMAGPDGYVVLPEEWLTTVRYTQAVGQLFTVFSEIGTRILERRREQEQLQRQTELRQNLEAWADKVTDAILEAGTADRPGWKAAVEEVQRRIHERAGSADVAALRAREQEVRAAAESLRQLLTESGEG